MERTPEPLDLPVEAFIEIYFGQTRVGLITNVQYHGWLQYDVALQIAGIESITGFLHSPPPPILLDDLILLPSSISEGGDISEGNNNIAPLLENHGPTFAAFVEEHEGQYIPLGENAGNGCNNTVGDLKDHLGQIVGEFKGSCSANTSND